MTPIFSSPDATTARLARPAPAPSAGGDPLLDRYHLVRVLGRGGMATVYLARDGVTGREVAVKVLAPHVAADPLFRQRLLAEARAAARLPHPHVVQVLDVVAAPGAEPAGAVAIAQEYVPGESLHQRLARGPLPPDEAVAVAAQVADALAFAHGRGVVHRDVKPHNVFLTAPPAGAQGVWAKLGDFGIARCLDAATSFTATGLMLGSAPYLAPEVLQGQRGGEPADLYALGVTLFEALAGHVPFRAATPVQALALRLTQAAPHVRASRPDAPAWLDEVVARCLARDPAARFPDAAAVRDALRRSEAPTAVLPTIPPTAVAPVAPVARATGRRRWLLAGTGALALPAIGAALRAGSGGVARTTVPTAPTTAAPAVLTAPPPTITAAPPTITATTLPPAATRPPPVPTPAAARPLPANARSDRPARLPAVAAARGRPPKQKRNDG